MYFVGSIVTKAKTKKQKNKQKKKKKKERKTNKQKSIDTNDNSYPLFLKHVYGLPPLA